MVYGMACDRHFGRLLEFASRRKLRSLRERLGYHCEPATEASISEAQYILTCVMVQVVEIEIDRPANGNAAKTVCQAYVVHFPFASV